MLQSYCQIHDESGCVCKLFAIEYVKNECLMKKVERNLGYHAQSEPLNTRNIYQQSSSHHCMSTCLIKHTLVTDVARQSESCRPVG